jgi:hypothetical protein
MRTKRTISLRHSAFLALAALTTAFAAAQDAPPSRPTVEGTPADPGPARGGWRRVTDPPPPTLEQSSRLDQGSPEAQSTSTPPGPPSPGYAPLDAYGQNRELYPNQPPPRGNYPPPNPGYQSSPGYQPNPGYQQNPGYQPNPGYQANSGYQPMPQVPPELTIRPGTYLTVRVDQPLSSDHNHPGDAFSGTLVRPLVIDGVVIAQRGQTVGGRVVEAQKAGRTEGVSRLAVEIIDLSIADGQQLTIKSQLVSRTGPTTVGRDAGAVGGTAAVGAIAGAAAGGGVGAGIGAGAGAVVGLIGVMVTRGHATMIYPESVLTFRIDTPVTISTGRAPQAFHYVDPQEYQRADNDQQRFQERAPRVAAPYYGYSPYYGPSYYPYSPYYYGVPGFSFFYGPRAYGGFYGGGFYSGGFYRGGGYFRGGGGYRGHRR